MNDVCVTDDHAYLFRDGVREERREEKKKKEDRREDDDTDAGDFSLSFFTFIRRQWLTDEMIIRLLSWRGTRITNSK